MGRSGAGTVKLGGRRPMEGASFSVDSLSVPKTRVEVTARYGSGQEHTLSLYVADGERVKRLLEDDRFLHATDQAGLFVALRTEHVAWLKLDPLDGIDEVDSEAEGASGVDIGVILRFADDSTLSGHLRYLRPAASARLSDYLEDETGTFVLHAEAGLYLVNPRQLVEVRPKEA